MDKDRAPLLPTTSSQARDMSSGTAATPVHASLKTLSLVVLIGQTTALVLFLRYSRTQVTEGPRYVSSTAVLVAEIVKVFVCFGVLIHQCRWNWRQFQVELNRDVFARPYDTLKMSIPAVLYVIQNNLLFLALSKLDAATYQVTYQLKILTTAFFTVVMLKRELNTFKWIALILLTVGVALVQLPSGDSSKAAAEEHGASDRLMGLAAVVAACLTSGYAGVYLENILKHGAIGLWMRNLQLAFFSIFGGFFMCYVYDYEAISKHGFLAGYNNVIWTVVMLQAFGGLVIALVVKFADNILKGFAVSLSIILSSFVSWFFLDDFTPSLTFAVGAAVVIASTFLYGMEQKPSRKS